jgi:tyrosine aminotransferase
LTSGCSDALNIAIASLVNPGDNILLPTPGFSLYRTICGRYNLTPRFYKLDPEKGWEIDLQYLEGQINAKTKAILINNPSNPCGSVFSSAHTNALVKLCHRHNIPIIADEIYDGMTWAEEKFTPLRHFVSADTPVPILTCGGISKQYLVPGWRVGWVVVSDPGNFMVEYQKGITNLTQVILGPNSLIQGALPTILWKTPQSFYTTVANTLQRHAEYLYEGLSKIELLTPIKPEGAMYMMVKVDLERLPGIESTTVFCKKLLWEERVFCLPGEAFQAPGFFRVVICPTLDILEVAIQRVKNFIIKHKDVKVNE